MVRGALSLAISLALVTAGATGPTMAAKADKPDKGSRREGSTATAVIESIPGAKLKMAKARVAKALTRIGDAAGDQLRADGTAATGAPAYSDIASVTVAPIKVPSKLLRKMDDDYPRGAVGAFYGKDASPAQGDRAVFVAVELADKRSGRSVVQQVEIGLDGDSAAPVQVGSAGDTLAGVERFSLSGIFADGSESSGTTDVSGRRPGGAIDYYNARSTTFGLYDGRRDSYELIMPLPPDARSVTVSLRTMTESGEVIDRLELPGGGHLIALADPTGGYDPASGAPPLACRALETFSAASPSVELADPGGTVIRYTAGTEPPSDAAGGDDLLAALDGYADTIPVTMTPLDGAGEPFEVDARLARAPGLGSFTISMEVPAGQWAFEAADGKALATPAGEPLIDHTSLTGQAGVRSGEGLDGFVSGDPRCGRWDLGADACAYVPADGMAALVQHPADDIEQTVLELADGAQWCVGLVPDTGQPLYRVRLGTDYATTEGFEAASTIPDCERYPVDLGAEGASVDCGSAGYERYAFRVVPEAIAGLDPDGGLLVTADLLVDASRPRGERYDVEAAMNLLGQLASDLAEAALPALAGGAGEAAPAGPPADEDPGG